MTTNEILDALWQAYLEHRRDKGGSLILERKVKAKWRKILNGPRQVNRVVVKLGNGHFLVSSDSRPGDFHSVEYVGASDYSCSCEDATLNKNEMCKHAEQIREVEQYV